MQALGAGQERRAATAARVSEKMQAQWSERQERGGAGTPARTGPSSTEL